jgi:hypothetical protein
MHIYIDEAGAFTPPRSRPHLYSLVLALVVPTSRQDDLFHQFLRLRDHWPQKGIEIKGSKLDETQTSDVMNLLAAHEAIAEYYAVDMALHSHSIVDEFKAHQAAAVTQNLTKKHHPNLVAGLYAKAEVIRNLANPLFVQALLDIELILQLIDVAINYFAQRRPDELGRFAWTIDRKDRTITEMEQIWTTFILPMGESRSAREPYVRVKGFNYSYFDAKYRILESTADPEMRRHLEWMRETLKHKKPLPPAMECIDAKRLLTEERTFADSRDSLGLQLADIAASTICRAFNGNLRMPGWAPAAQILIRKKKAPLMLLGRAASYIGPLETNAAKVWRTLDAKGQSMMV